MEAQIPDKNLLTSQFHCGSGLQRRAAAALNSERLMQGVNRCQAKRHAESEGSDSVNFVIWRCVFPDSFVLED